MHLLSVRHDRLFRQKTDYTALSEKAQTIANTIVHDYGIESAAKSGGTLLFLSYRFILPEYDIAMAVISSGGSTCINFITVSHNSETVLPANGKVIFIGNAGDVFEIEL